MDTSRPLEMPKPAPSLSPQAERPEAAPSFTPRKEDLRAPSDLFASGAADSQETDVWYGGYAGRTMTAGFLACLGLTLAALVIWRVYAPQVGSGRQMVWALVVFGLVGAAWLFQTFRWGYRQLAFASRLTTRRLFHARGFLYDGWQVVEMAHVTRVEVRCNLWERCLGVGRVYIFCESSPEAAVVLRGVSRPLTVAETLRHQATQARKEQIVALQAGVESVPWRWPQR